MWKIAPHTDAVGIDGEWVILDGQRCMVTKLNEAGGWIWSRLKEGATLEMLTADLTEEFEVGTQQARTDIEVFVEHLIACGLIEHVA